jgi:hypothetical protein
MVLAPFRTRSRCRAGQSASQDAHWTRLALGCWLTASLLPANFKVCRRVAAAREQTRTQRPVEGSSIKSGLVQSKTTVLDPVHVGTGRAPQAVRSWLHFSTDFFGCPRGKDETLLDFRISASGKGKWIGEIVRTEGLSILCLDASELRRSDVSIISSERIISFVGPSAEKHRPRPYGEVWSEGGRISIAATV